MVSLPPKYRIYIPSNITDSILDIASRITSDIFWKIKKEKTLEISTSSDEVVAKFDMTTPSDRDRIPRRYTNELPLLEDLIKNLEPDDVFYDVGANTGIFSSFALKILSEGTVVAFEPYPRNIIQLHKNLEKNGDDYKILGVPVLESSQIVGFLGPVSGTTGKGSASITETNSKFKTFALSGDRLIQDQNIPSPSIIKIDVEGCEPLVLRGLDNILNQPTCRRLYIEIHLDNGNRGKRCVEHFGETGESILEMISGFGFNIENVIKDDDRRWHVIASKAK